MIEHIEIMTHADLRTKTNEIIDVVNNLSTMIDEVARELSHLKQATLPIMSNELTYLKESLLPDLSTSWGSAQAMPPTHLLNCGDEKAPVTLADALVWKTPNCPDCETSPLTCEECCQSKETELPETADLLQPDPQEVESNVPLCPVTCPGLNSFAHYCRVCDETLELADLNGSRCFKRACYCLALSAPTIELKLPNDVVGSTLNTDYDITQNLDSNYDLTNNCDGNTPPTIFYSECMPTPPDSDATRIPTPGMTVAENLLCPQGCENLKFINCHKHQNPLMIHVQGNEMRYLKCNPCVKESL